MEVPRLRHRITVLEGMVGTHQKNAQDCYSELCAKSEAYEALLTEKNQLEEKLGHLRELRDMQDELDQANLNLSKMEKSLERLRSENESLCGYRDQVTELEAKLMDYDLTHSKLHEYKEVKLTVQSIKIDPPYACVTSPCTYICNTGIEDGLAR